MTNKEYLWTDQVFFYLNGKVAGKPGTFYLSNEALQIYTGTAGGAIAGQVGKKFGLIGGLIGGVAKGVSKEKNANLDKINQADLTLSFEDIVKVSKNKSLANGTGLSFEMRDGQKIKIVTDSMKFGGYNQVALQIIEVVSSINSNIINEI